MKFPTALVIFAFATLAAADTTKILSKCYTGLGKSSTAKVGTTSYALSFTVKEVRTKTVTPSTTITPKAFTLTTTRVSLQTTTTTLPRITDTFTSTIVEATTRTSTLILPTVTSKIDVGVTSTLTSTSTVATPNGFVPLRSQFPNARRGVTEEHAGRVNLRATEKKKCSSKVIKHIVSPTLYPSTVRCAALFNVYKTSTVTKTAAKVSTITAPTPLVTVSVTTVSVITSTIKPIIAQTTIFRTSVVISVIQQTITPTSIVTSTTTVTETEPGATTYAACAANNQVASVNGALVLKGASSVSFSSINTESTNPYDCCVDCQENGDCYGYNFMSYNFMDSNSCLLLALDDVAQGQCGQSPTGVALTFDLNGTPEMSSVIGNGPCGQYTLSDTPV
ncbi:hypothetical protein HBI56_156000 [Parastagonospora nodorum]|uniref:Apple domain-containing protein n=2 Tax=Phaeosphaeria nodorum (strain SN15 / ATCC MYA-4574 / FGSC 10173) TaxID=321614 RepID=A0A7U2NNZ5_PHANO|nr:hypothetical protein SNOG_11209 [Parastagonospora nodorum SN15]KAH3912733.1 hypothetical protein HBH56_118690 [Parastagonospora nodorum]EAT81708.1 hypothetical protein SNOG_11209 [Parastagonospora nodorum SN15]KAH3929074.1 hypothetical protein HBH54_130500 [Parastagonospora nodorum]KAH3950831.1 hypothetical protein HBH53_070780 [Parastagonospora nodorum]KAH3959741.1 hypothetical protein HBH51_197100 [Parastagonospora nodorum]